MASDLSNIIVAGHRLLQGGEGGGHSGWGGSGTLVCSAAHRHNHA
jgi:hypothetical protein